MNVKKKNNRRTLSEGNENSFPELLKNSSIGAGIGLIAAVLFLFIGTGVCYVSNDPTALITPVGVAVLYLSAFIGGMIAKRLNKTSALFCGGICGCLLTVFFWFLTLFFNHTDSDIFSFPLSLVLRGLTILVSILGAVIGTGRKKVSKRRRH